MILSYSIGIAFIKNPLKLKNNFRKFLKAKINGETYEYKFDN